MYDTYCVLYQLLQYASLGTGTVVRLKFLCQKSCVCKKKGSDTKNFQRNGSILKDRTLEQVKEFENRIVTNIWAFGVLQLGRQTIRLLEGNGLNSSVLMADG